MRRFINSVFIADVFFIGGWFRCGRSSSRNDSGSFFLNILMIFITALPRLKLYQIAFWVILGLGTLSLFIQPIGNIPDEFSHIARSEATSRLCFFFPNETGEYASIRSVLTILENGRVPYPAVREFMNQPVDTSAVTYDTMVRGNIFYVYLPQGFGMLLAKLFHASNIAFLWMGRFFNLLAYAFIARLALKIMPKFKMPLFFVAALPMSIQQAASCSPDAMMNGLSFLLIGYFVYLLCDERKLIGKRELIIYMLLAALTGVAKLNNLVLAALILTIPKWRFQKPERSVLIKIAAVIAPVIIGVAYYGYTLTFPSAPLAQDSYQVLNNVNSSLQYEYILHNFFPWLRSFVFAMVKNLPSHIMQLNRFGWLDQQSTLLTVIMAAVFAYLIFKKEHTSLSFWSKLFIFLIMLGDYTLISFALYTTWTPVGSPTIVGVQGRYFIPFIGLAPLVFSRKGCNQNGAANQAAEVITTPQLTRLVAVVTAMSGVMFFMLITKYY